MFIYNHFYLFKTIGRAIEKISSIKLLEIVSQPEMCL